MISWCDHILIRTAVAVLVLCAVLSCSDDTAVMEELDRAEAVMEEYPDSALALLDTLDRSWTGPRPSWKNTPTPRSPCSTPLTAAA